MADAAIRSGARRPRAGARRERGAALVEFAIVFPLLFLLVSGMIDFGMLFVNLNSARQGVREGARQGVVANFGGSSTCTLTGAGSLDLETKELMCLTKARIGLTAADTRVKVAFVGTNSVGNSLLVCAQYPRTSMTGVFAPLLNGSVMTSKVEMRIEKVDLALTAGEETALSGTTWSWCT